MNATTTNETDTIDAIRNAAEAILDDAGYGVGGDTLSITRDTIAEFQAVWGQGKVRMMHYYEIDCGGLVSGEVVVEAGAPDENGLVVMGVAEYNRQFSRTGRACRGRENYHEGYDVTSRGDCVVLHPACMGFDSAHVQDALGITLSSPDDRRWEMQSDILGTDAEPATTVQILATAASLNDESPDADVCCDTRAHQELFGIIIWLVVGCLAAGAVWGGIVAVKHWIG